MMTRLGILLALLALALPATAADLDDGNNAQCGAQNTWTEAAGADSSAFYVSACGAQIVNTGTAAISIYSAKMSTGAKGGLLRTLAPTTTADCNDASTCGVTWVPRGRYILDCAASACTADVIGQ